MRVSDCVYCRRPMSHTTRRWKALPGTMLHVANGLCKTCWNRPRVVAGDLRNLRGSRSEPADEIAVERACAGDRVQLNATERRVAVWACQDKGMSICATARLLGLSSRTVQRLRNLRASLEAVA